MSRRHTGFTLVELLTVIAIFSVLVAMVLPMHKDARDRARRIVCLNNVKEMCLAFEMYKQDFDGWYPLCGWGFTEEDYNAWVESGGGWGGGTYPDLGHPVGACWVDTIAPYVMAEKRMFVCPSDPDPDDFEWYCWGGETEFSKCSYAANEDIVGIDNWGNNDDEHDSGAEGRIGGDARKVKNPSRVVLIIDADHIWVNSQGSDSWDNLLDRVLLHHQNGFNAVFCDGSARWVQEGKVDEVTLNPGCLY